MNGPILEGEIHMELRDTQPSQSLIINAVYSSKLIEYERLIAFNQSCLLGTSITFQNLSSLLLVVVILSSTIGQKQILKNVIGFYFGGKLSAILGGSGAGKTSLLNIMACRLEKSNHSKVSGQLQENGHNYDYRNLIILLHILCNTIFHYNHKQQLLLLNLSTVMRILSSRRLIKLQNYYNFVGGLFRKGLSGGERKGLSIALELVSDPHCLILDEPNT